MVTSIIQQPDENSTISKTSLMHDIYRMLLNTGRTYAAFERERIEPLLERLRDRKLILDPMSGYGSLMTYCAQSDYELHSFDIECNAPSYFWQLLQHPGNNKLFINIIEAMLPKIDSLPDASCLATISDEWFSDESAALLAGLWNSTLNICDHFIDSDIKEVIALAYMLPFVGRLAGFVQGNVVTHVKPGGICVYKGWKNDFYSYNLTLLNNLRRLKALTKRSNHKLVLGDSRTIKLPRNKFSAMITSPPYPNSRDYSSMFAPENAFIKLLKDIELLPIKVDNVRLIGSPRVSEKNGYSKRTINDIKSKVAANFIAELSSIKCSKNAKYDNDVYYIPYYCNYFSDIEKAYENISKSFQSNFEGYVVVVNNTARKKIIPVAETIVETWERLGFNACIDREFTRELSHVGGINPGVKGLSARHMEYTIKIWRK